MDVVLEIKKLSANCFQVLQDVFKFQKDYRTHLLLLLVLVLLLYIRKEFIILLL